MTKAEVNEALTVLYLRLAGYFTTGLVVHAAEWGQNRTEVDCLAIRLPHHDQSERGVSPPPFLGLPTDQTDLLICEVKSSIGALKFNDRLRGDAEVVASALQWAGLFDKQITTRLADRVRALLQIGVAADTARAGVTEGSVRVRGLLSCPPCEGKEAAETWFLTGSEILRFAHECFNPPQPRNECSTRYDFHLWGSWLSPIVDYLKGCTGQKRPTLDGLYKHVGG